MNYRTNLLLIAVGCIMLSACNLNAPKPCFELSCESLNQMDCILAGEEVFFKNCTDNGMSYSWDFGDGTTSTLSSPRHAFELAGNYTVTMTAENEDAEKSISQDVTVSPSLYGSWEGSYTKNDEEVGFTFNLEQSATKIKGGFWTAGPFEEFGFMMGFNGPNGVLGSNSEIIQDSVKLHGALMYSFDMGDGESMTFSVMHKFEGTVNESMDEMQGEVVMEATMPFGPWHATKKK